MTYPADSSVLLPNTVAARIQGDLRDLAHVLRNGGHHEAAKDVRRRSQMLEVDADCEDLLAALTDQMQRMGPADLIEVEGRLRHLALAARLRADGRRRDEASTRDQIRADLEGVTHGA